MFFSDWYFCHTLKMSPADTNDYLEFLFTLEERGVSFSEKKGALDWIDSQGDPLMQAYAIPGLIKGILNEETSDHLDEGQERRAYLQKSKKLISDLLEKAEESSNIGNFLSIIQNMDEMEDKELIDQLLLLPYAEPEHECEFSYLESEERAYPIALLSILDVLAKRDSRMISEAIAETDLKLIDAALNGKEGMLPWKLAMLLRCYCGMTFDEAKDYFTNDWAGSAECLEITALLVLENEKKSKTSSDSVVKSLMEETSNLYFFEKNGRGVPTEGFWINEKADYQKSFKTCAILWQNILWNTAFEYDAESCITQLRLLWNAPVYGYVRRTGQRRKRNVLLPAHARVMNTDECPEYFFCTPWQRRTCGKTKRADGEKLFQEFEDMLHNESAFRLFAAAVLLRRLMGVMQIFPVEYCRILLNMGDVFQCRDIERELEGEQKYWDNSVRILGFFARRCIEKLGRGEINDRIPGKLIEELYKGRARETKNNQLNEQYRITGVQVCAHWALESLRAAPVREGHIIESPWFLEEKVSCAEQLCIWFFENGIRMEEFDYEDPVIMCFQVFPKIYKQVRESLYNDSWIEKYVGSSERINFCDIMFSPEVCMEEWDRIEILDKSRFDRKLWLTVLTMRLLSLLKEGNVEDRMIWYEEWRDENAAYLSEEEAYGILFYLLCELLRVEFPENRVPSIYLEVLNLVMGTIHEYTTEGTIFYQYYLNLSMKEVWKRYGIKTGGELIAGHVKELYRKREAIKGKELLEDLLAQTVEMPQDVKKEIFDSMDTYWKERCSAGKHYGVVCLENGEWDPLTDFELQDNDGQLSVIRPIQNSDRAFFEKTKNLFKAPAEAEAEGWYVGIVINDVKNWGRTEEKKYYIQYGTGSIGYFASRAFFRKGETVGIKLNYKWEISRISKLAWKDDERPLIVEVTAFSAKKLGLRLPNGEGSFVSNRQKQKFSELLTLWEPDTAHIIKMEEEGQTVFNLSREVCFDKKTDFYIPVERDFYRLIIERFLSREEGRQSLRLTFINEAVRNGKHGFLFSADLGINYFLTEENWECESFRCLERKLEDGSRRQGLAVTVCLQLSGERLFLSLNGENCFDTKNWEWEDCFSEEEFFAIRKDGQEGSEWYADVEVEGMPKRVRAVFPPFCHINERTMCNVQLRNGGWNKENQRNGIVEVERLQSRKLKESWRTPDGFRRLREVKVGDTLILENTHLRRQRDGYRPMLTESGLPVYCAAESLSLEAEDDLVAEMISGRLCVVEYSDLREAKEETGYKPAELPEMKECEEFAEGIVSQFTEELNTAEEDTTKLSVGLWVKAGEGIVSVQVPVTAFRNKPRAVGAPVTAERQENGSWVFKAFIRRIQVRALWQVEDYNTGRRGMFQGIRLGKDMNIPGYGQRLVTQAEDRPYLYLWNTDMIEKGSDDLICGVELGKGNIAKIRRRNFPWETFPYAKHRDLVRLAENGKEYYGDCRWGDFEEENTVKDWSVHVSVHLFLTENGKQYYDMRRIFNSRNVRSDLAHMDRSEKKKRLLNEQYIDWINAGDYHVIGAEIIEDRERKLRLENLKVPLNIEKDTLRDKWTDKVVFSKEDKIWVPGRYYPKNRVRALLVRKDNIWVASCHETSPFYVNNELAGEFNIISGDIIRRKIYYAGLDEENQLRFEWGYGFHFLVDEDDILDEDGNKIGNNLFYGDMITSFRMIKGRGKYGWYIQVEYKALVRQVERRVWEDSFSGKAIVQLLEIHRDLEEKKVHIERVSVTEEVVQKMTGNFNGWDFHKVSSAYLEQESVSMLLDEEGYEQETKIIFARLRPETDRKRVTSLTFTYLPLNGKTGDVWLLEGQTVCMVAGEIKVIGGEGTVPKNRLNNDYMISLFLPGELPRDGRTPQMCVNVLRREFSVDESRLRTLYRNNKEKYYGCKMLVRLKKRNEKNDSCSDWEGNIISTPKRTRESLEEWVKSQDRCLVSLGMENGKLLAEVAPGILSPLPQDAIRGTFSQGTIASLWMEADEMKGEIVLPGDGKYLPDGGRPAELLVLDGAAKKYRMLQLLTEREGMLDGEERQDLNKELDKAQFTVAGLSQLLVTDRRMLERKISEPIPRLAYLVKNRNPGTDKHEGIQGQERTGFFAARLLLNEEERPELHYFYPDARIKTVEWNQISFMDGTIRELVETIKKAQWHYHDRKTAIYHSENHRLEVVALPDGKKYNEIILFPDERGRLRYREEEFVKYGYPAREIIENGLPRNDGEYAVAGVTENSIWIELFPGKLLEIPTAYLYTGEKKIPLAEIWTGMLAVGDKIRLSQDEGFGGNQKKLVLEDVIFGGRAGFGRSNVFLPVQRETEGGLILGTDLWTVVLPVEEPGKWIDQKFVRISQNNEIFGVEDNQKIVSGDILPVCCGTPRLLVKGWNSLKITPAYRELWKNAEWLLDDIVSKEPKAKEWMKKVLLTMPLEVRNVRRADGNQQVFVFYSQADMNSLPNDTKLCCICAGLRKGKEGLDEMVVRAGRVLLSIPVQNILPGIEQKRSAAITEKLRKEKTRIWIHKEEEGWFGGLRKEKEKEWLEVHLLFCVEAAAGILCLTRDTLALRWLPAEEAARAGKIDSITLWEALYKRRDRLAKRLDNGSLSLIELWQNIQKYGILKKDGTRYRTTPVKRVDIEESEETYCYLAELYPKGDLIRLYSEIEYNCDRGETIPIEIVDKQPECVVAYPYRMRRRKLHLTPWVYEAIGRASASDELERFAGINLHRFRQEIPECFSGYRFAQEKADQDGKKKQLDYDFLQDHERTSEQLIYLYTMISGRRDKELNFYEIYEFIRLTLKAWLESEGKFLVSGLDMDIRSKQISQIDIAPAVVAILLLNTIRGSKDDGRLEQIAKPLSVHLARMLGIGCGCSIHQEILLRQWLLWGERRKGLWLRLNQLSLRGENCQAEPSEVFNGQLTPRQIRKLQNICYGLKIHTSGNEELRLVADSILLSVGNLKACDEFCRGAERKNCIMLKLSVLGRILTPGAGSSLAKNNLSRDDVKNLHDIFIQLLKKDEVPLSLVGDTPIPVSEIVKKNGMNLCESFCKIAVPSRERE